ncbi:MAG TPA: hypothetical protein VN758_10390 [Solirubrobacterales bacterium]|nr:hypothetical protein [Solirubrobacterales bacterium]
MKKIAILGVLGALALAVPAQATTEYTPAPSPPPHKPKPHHDPKGPHHPKGPHKCKPHSVGYNASGTLVSAAFTPAEKKGRYDGTVEVNVTRANHHAPTGTQTYTLDSARVKFHHGVDAAAPAPGSRVKLHGKITQLSKHCSQEGFTPVITVKKVDIRQAPAQPKG